MTPPTLAEMEADTTKLGYYPLLLVEHLTMRFGGLTAVNDVSFSVHDGHITALLGPHGAGKTPVFNMARGTIPGEMHLSQGHEPCAVGVCAHLTDDDAVTATHRPHHIAIAQPHDHLAL